MTFDEIKQEVFSLTNHAEMDAEVTSAVKAATLRLHQSDYYERDVVEAKVVLPAAAYIHQFDYKATFSRFRHIKYLRKWDPTGVNDLTQQNTGAAGTFFNILTPEQILDAYSVTKPNTAYLAGSNLNIRSNTEIQQLLAAWYQNPLITDTTRYTSWIADQVPYAIIFDACSLIFQMIAQQDQSRKFDGLVAEQLQMVKMIGLATKGY